MKVSTDEVILAHIRAHKPGEARVLIQSIYRNKPGIEAFVTSCNKLSRHITAQSRDGRKHTVTFDMVTVLEP